MTQILPFSNPSEQTTMSSREIAELVGSSHDSVLKTVRRLIAEGVVSGNETLYTHPQNGQQYPEFVLGFRDTMVVASGYSAELRARIIDRWQELEAQAAKPARPALPHDYISALEHLLVSEKGRLQAVAALDQATAQLTIAAPKADALDRLTKSDGDLCITNAAKALGLRPKDLFAHLQQEKWIYRRVGGSGWVGYQSRIQVGYLTHKVTTIERSDGTEKAIEQVLVTPKGLAKLAIDLNSKKAA